jgi:two-component system, LytTR family, response regulator
MRVLIADDEAPAREFLRRLLASHSDVEVVGEAGNGADAINLASSTKPDLLLLDVQMPGGTGLDVAASLPGGRPAVIFCTAYDQHAVEAFELNAVDYLLKPVTRARLSQALDRVRKSESAEAQQGLNQLVRNREEGVSRFLVRRGAHYVVVPASQAAYFESVDGLTRMSAEGGENYWIDPPLQDLEARLDSHQFYRISRNALVNLSQVTELHPLPGGSAEVTMKGGVRLEVSRRRFRGLVEILEKS